MFGRKKRMAALGVDAHRGVMFMSLRAERGWEGPSAGVATLAVHPLDDEVEPSRGFEDLVRARAENVARLIGSGASETEVKAAAVDALHYYVDRAKVMGEAHYAVRYDDALSKVRE